MQNKTILVTGSTDGIGRQTALELAQMGATVFVHGRDPARGERVVHEIRRETGNGRVASLTADFGELAQVRRLAEEVREKGTHLDVLLHNAGVFMNERVLTVDGYETTFAVNHLAPFLLTHLLRAETAAPARIVTVASVAHQRGQLDFGNLQGERHFSPYGAYALSKLANVMFALELAEQLRGTGVTSNCLHPGVISTKLLREGFDMGGDSVEAGAETSVYLASSPEVENVTGKYFVRKRITAPAPAALDQALRTRLWEESARMVGV